MHSLEIANAALKNINPNDYTISIRPRPGGFCFVLYDRTAHRFPVLFDAKASSAATLLDVWTRMGIEGERFYHINVLSHCEKWTLLPQEMRGADRTAAWKLAFGEEPGTPLNESPIAPVDACCIFEACEKSRQLQQHFTNATLWPTQAADLLHAVQTSQANLTHYMGLNAQDKQVNLYIVENGRLLLANTFATETTTDALYFAMNAARTFQLDQKETLTEVWGKNAEETAKLLRHYLQKAKVAELDSRFAYDSGIKKLANKQEYYDLFNIATCAL